MNALLHSDALLASKRNEIKTTSIIYRVSGAVSLVAYIFLVICYLLPAETMEAVQNAAKMDQPKHSNLRAVAFWALNFRYDVVARVCSLLFDGSRRVEVYCTVYTKGSPESDHAMLRDSSYMLEIP